MATSVTSSGLQFSDNSIQPTLAFIGFRNRIINGDMKISQRGTSFAAANGYTLDRFAYGFVSSAVVTITQNSDVPTSSGLSNSLRTTVTTLDSSIAVGDYSILIQAIEGYNAADLVGVPFTVSFWVKSSKLGVHCFRLRNSIADSTYVVEYTIITANTWEKKTITIANGLPTGGTWNFTNGIGLVITWILAAGSSWQTATPNSWVSSNPMATVNQVNCLDTVGNIFAITGVQLEKGSNSTEFEVRPYSVELAMCQRYYETGTAFITGYQAAGNYAGYTVRFVVTKRITPTVSVSNVSVTRVGATPSTNHIQPVGFSLYHLTSTAGIVTWLDTYTASAEL